MKLTHQSPQLKVPHIYILYLQHYSFLTTLWNMDVGYGILQGHDNPSKLGCVPPEFVLLTMSEFVLLTMSEFVLLTMSEFVLLTMSQFVLLTMSQFVLLTMSEFVLLLCLSLSY